MWAALASLKLASQPTRHTEVIIRHVKDRFEKERLAGTAHFFLEHFDDSSEERESEQFVKCSEGGNLRKCLRSPVAGAVLSCCLLIGTL